MDLDQGLLGIGEVAERLGYSASNIRRLDRVGELRAAVRISGRRIFRLDEVERFQREIEKRRAAKAVA